MQNFETKPKCFHQPTLSQASWEISLLIKPEIMNRDNSKEGEHNGEFHDRGKKSEKKTKKTYSGDETWHMCNIFPLLGSAQILFLIKSIIHVN